MCPCPQDPTYAQRSARGAAGTPHTAALTAKIYDSHTGGPRGKKAHVEPAGIHVQLPHALSLPGTVTQSVLCSRHHVREVSAQGSHRKGSGWSHRRPLPPQIQIPSSRRESRCSGHTICTVEGPPRPALSARESSRSGWGAGPFSENSLRPAPVTLICIRAQWDGTVSQKHY